MRSTTSSCSLIVALLSFWQPVADAFLGPALPMHKACASSLQASANGEVAVATIVERNIFHEYDKPIVLLGLGTNDELSKLAGFLHDEHLKGGKVISLKAGSSVEGILSEHRWPDICVLDFKDDSVHNSAKLAQSLYEGNVLSVYVNINPSGMDKETSTKKKKLEDDVFVPYSDYELCIRDEDPNNPDWKHIEWELARLLARARLVPAVPGDKTRTSNSAHLTMGDHTFFLSLSFPDITQVEPYVQDMCPDVDAMEYRADLLERRDSRFDLLYGMQLLRRYCRPYVARSAALPFGSTVLEDVMPIVYTVRTAGQAGTYPDDAAGIANMFELLSWGLRGGVEVLDVESAWDYIQTRDLLDKAEQRYSSLILGSHHVVGQEVTTEEAVDLFRQCALNGRAHGAKVVLSIENEENDRMAYEAALITTELAAADKQPVVPKISLILGDSGQFSRIINLPFTPVTHEALPFKAAPGQLTASEIMTTRILTQIFQSKKFCILGHNICLFGESPNARSGVCRSQTTACVRAG